MKLMISVLMMLTLAGLILFFGVGGHRNIADRLVIPGTTLASTNEIAESSIPIAVGEKLSYVASWSNFVAAGKLSMETQESTDKSTIRLIADFAPTGLVKSIYNVNHHYDSTVEKTSLLPNQFITRIREQTKSGPEEKQTEVKFDQSKHTARIDNKTFSIAPQTYDFISLLYAMRKLELKDGKTYKLMGFDGKNNFATEVEVLGREDVDLGSESRKAIKVAVRYSKDGEKPSDDYEVRIWFSDDAAHLPLVIMANPPFGLVKAELRSVASADKQNSPAAPSEDKIKP